MNAFNNKAADPLSWWARVFQTRPLGWLWAGQLISQAGDAVFDIGLLWLLLDLTGSSGTTGLVAMAAYLPSLLFGMFAGALVDRFDRRTLLLVSDGARFLIVLAIPLLYYLDGLGALVLGLLTFARALFGTVFNPARDALIPALVPPTGLLAANSLIQTCWQFGLLLGPGLAGVLVPFTGEVHLFTADALSYLASFCFLWLLPRALPRQAAPVPDPADHTRRAGPRASGRVTEHPRADHSTGLLANGPATGLLAAGRAAMAEVNLGLARAWRDRRIAVLLGVTAVDNLFIMGPAIIGTPLFVRQVLGLGSGAYALSMTAYALGMLTGTVLLNRFGRRYSLSHILLWGIVLDGLTFLPLLWVDSLAGLYTTLFVHSLVIPMIVVARPTLVQRLVEPAMQGRIFSLIGVCVTGLSALSVALTGWVCTLLPVNQVFGAIALLAAATGAAGWLVKEFRQAGNEPHEAGGHTIP